MLLIIIYHQLWENLVTCLFTTTALHTSVSLPCPQSFLCHHRQPNQMHLCIGDHFSNSKTSDPGQMSCCLHVTSQM